MSKITDQFDAGSRAYFNAVPRASNPWCQDYPELRQQWFDGWDDCEAEVMSVTDTVPMDEIYRLMAEPVA